MRTREKYLGEVGDVIDKIIGEPYIENLHRQVRYGLCLSHRQRLDEEISSDGLAPAEEMGKILLLRAARITTMPTPAVWQRDTDLRERLVVVYTEYVWQHANGQEASPAPTAYPSQGSGSEPYLN